MEKSKKILWMIIIVSLFLTASTVTAWYLTQSLATRESFRRFNDEATIVETWIVNRLEFYKTIAYGLQGFWAGKEEATQEERQAYLETLKIKERFPGITAVNFIRQKDDDFFFAFIYPPEVEATMKGKIIASPERLEAIKRAVDQASFTFTDKVSLIPDQGQGFIMYAPLYKKGLPVGTIEERKTALKGLTAIVLKSNQAFRDLFDAHDPFPYLDFEIFKGQVLDENHILYDHDYSYYLPKIETEKQLYAKRAITIDKETFTLLVAAKPSFGLTPAEKRLPNLVLFAGLALDGLIFALALNQSRRLQEK